MTPVEIIALIFVVIGVIKLVVLMISPKSWKSVPDAFFKQPILMMLVSFVLAAIVLYYLLTEMTIVQIAAVMLFTLLLLLEIPAAVILLKLSRERHGRFSSIQVLAEGSVGTATAYAACGSTRVIRVMHHPAFPSSYPPGGAAGLIGHCIDFHQ